MPKKCLRTNQTKWSVIKIVLQSITTTAGTSWLLRIFFFSRRGLMIGGCSRAVFSQNSSKLGLHVLPDHRLNDLELPPSSFHPQDSCNPNIMIIIAFKGAIRDFFTISSQRRELSPTCTLKWPWRNRVQITCNTSSADHVQVSCYVPLGTKG